MWSANWTTNDGENLLYPNNYNELREALAERTYADPGRLGSSGLTTAYALSEGKFIDSAWFGTGVPTSAFTFGGGVFRSGGRYEDSTSAGDDPPTLWTEASMLTELGDASIYPSPDEAILAPEYCFQMYSALNLQRRAYSSLLSLTFTTQTRPAEGVVDYVEWDFYTGDVTINSTLYTVGSSVTLWTNSTTSYLFDGTSTKTGHAKELKVNVLAIPASGQKYGIGKYDGTNGFKYRNW